MGALPIIRMYIVKISAIILSTMFLYGCFEEPVPPLRIGTNVWTGYEPLYLARDLNYIDENSITLVELFSAEDVIRAMKSKRIDVATLTVSEAIMLQSEGYDIKIVLVMNFSNGGEAIVSQHEINSVAQLKGKVIGIELQTVSNYLLSRALSINNLSSSDVVIKNIRIEEHLQAIQDKTIDAAVTFDPMRIKLLKCSSLNEIFTSKEIPEEMIDVMVIRNDVIERHNQHIPHIVNAWFDAIDYINSNKNDAATRMNNRLKIGTENVINSMNAQTFINRPMNIDLITGRNPRLVGNLMNVQSYMLDNKFLTRVEPVQDLFLERIPGLTSSH